MAVISVVHEEEGNRSRDKHAKTDKVRAGKSLSFSFFYAK